MGGLGRVFQALWVLLPHWVVGVMVAVTALLMIPGWKFRRRTTRIREAIRQMVRAEPGDVTRLTARVWEQAEQDPDLLTSVVREARRRELPALAHEALARLDAAPGGVPLANKLRAEVTRVVDHTRDRLVTALRIETMIGDDRLEAAREALVAAEATWPDDPQLTHLRAKLEAAADAPPRPPVEEASDA